MQGPPGDWSGGPGAPGMFAVRPHSPAGAPPSAVGPFVCHICAKQFARANNLKSHMLSHSQEKPYKCRYCDMAFVRAYDQRRHERGHTTESKAFTCQYCGKGFTRHDALSRHQGMLKSTAPVCPQLGKDGSLPTPSPRGGAARKRGGGQQPASQPEPASDEAPDQQQPPRGSGEYDAAATAAAGQLAYGDYALRQGFPPQPAFAGPGVSQDPMVNFYAQQAAQAQAAAAAAAAAASQQAAMQAAYRPDWSYGGYAGYGQAAQGYFGAYDAQLAAAGTGMVQGTMNGQNFTYYPPFGAGGIAPQAAADAGGYWSAGYAQQQGGFPGAGTSPGWPQQTSQPPTTPSQPPTTVPFSHPHLLPKIAKIVAESLDQTAPVLHYPTFVARAIVGRVSQVLVDTVVWAAAITSVRKGDTLAREIDAAMGGIGLQGLQERCRSSIMAAFDAFDRAGRPVVNATTRPARLALLQSAILACVTHSRAGNTEEAHDIHAVAVAVHASMRFGDPDCPSTAAYRARCDAMPLVDYLDAEEHCRACVVGANVDSAISALRDHRPTILLSQYPGVALPSTDTGFAMLPAAVEHSWTAAVSALPAFGIEQADGRRPIGQWLDRMQMEGLWPADRRYPLSCSESVLWMEKAPGPERERALGIAVGGLLDNGQTAAATLLVLVNDRVRMVRRWFGERKLAVHRPGEWDASLDPPQGPVPQALVQEAEGMRAATQEMLREFQEKVPIVLKGLDGEGDGKGLVEIGEEKWGKVAGHRLLHCFLWYHSAEILLHTPRNWLHMLRHPDPDWIHTPGFTHANAHAICVSRLIKSVLPMYAGDPWLAGERFPASTLLPILSAGMVHVQYLLQYRKHAEASVPMIRELVVDIQACLQTLAHNVGHWENAKAAYGVFVRLADDGEQSWAQAASRLGDLKGVGAILEPMLEPKAERS